MCHSRDVYIFLEMYMFFVSEKDIIDPEVVVKDGFIEVPQKAGIGYEVNRETIDLFIVAQKTYK